MLNKWSYLQRLGESWVIAAMLRTFSLLFNALHGTIKTTITKCWLSDYLWCQMTNLLTNEAWLCLSKYPAAVANATFIWNVWNLNLGRHSAISIEKKRVSNSSIKGNEQSHDSDINLLKSILINGIFSTSSTYRL